MQQDLEKSNPTLLSDDARRWFFRCEGPGPHGRECPDYRVRSFTDMHEAERDLTQSNWEQIDGRWFCENCVRKIGKK